MVYNPLTGMNDNRVPVEKRDLADISIKEVSLVKKGANRKRFLFFKSSEDGGALDLCNILDGIDEFYTLSAEENAHIEKALKTLSVLESDDVDALSNVVLLLSQLIANEPDETPVAKQQADKLWPSVSAGIPVSKSEKEEKPVMTGDRAQESLSATFGSVHQNDEEDD